MKQLAIVWGALGWSLAAWGLFGLAGCGPEVARDATTSGSSGAAARREPTQVDSAQPVALRVGRPGYASSSACQECHASEYNTWHDSYHRTMTQWATPESVVAPFDTVLESRGREYRLETRGDEFWVTMVDPELDQRVSGLGGSPAGIRSLKTNEFRVKLTTGSHLAQTYWIETKSGLMQMPWMYHIQEQTWIPNEDSFLLPPAENPLYSCWNNNCVKCHTVAPMPGYEQNVYRSQVAELGIACEACHGPGETHIQFHRERRRPGGGTTDVALRSDPIVNPARLSPERGSQVCAQCHSAHLDENLDQWVETGSPFLPGQDLEKYVTMNRHGTKETDAVYDTGYWDDGTVRTGGDEYLGMITSTCFQQGSLSCLSCHSMHDYASTTDQLKPAMDSDESCFQCHETYRERIAEHTHHSVDSSGARCANCHMPHVVYALFKGIRSHRIDSPSAAVTASTGRPNACNLCHLDQTLAWTAEKLHDWYDQPMPSLNEEQQTLSSTAVMALQGDAAQRLITAWHLAWDEAVAASGDDWQAAYLAQLLDDPYSMIRYNSYQALKQLPGFADFTYDFTADAASLTEAQERALQTWRTLGEAAPREPRPAVLLDETGQLLEERVRQLLEARDDRRIVIPE